MASADDNTQRHGQTQLCDPYNYRGSVILHVVGGAVSPSMMILMRSPSMRVSLSALVAS